MSGQRTTLRQLGRIGPLFALAGVAGFLLGACGGGGGSEGAIGSNTGLTVTRTGVTATRPALTGSLISVASAPARELPTKDGRCR